MLYLFIENIRSEGMLKKRSFFAAVLIIIGLRGHMLGVADSIVVGIMSWIIGIRRAVATFLLALIFISVMSGVLLALRKVKLKDTIPFLPFMFFSFVGVVLCG